MFWAMITFVPLASFGVFVGLLWLFHDLRRELRQEERQMREQRNRRWPGLLGEDLGRRVERRREARRG